MNLTIMINFQHNEKRFRICHFHCLSACLPACLQTPNCNWWGSSSGEVQNNILASKIVFACVYACIIYHSIVNIRIVCSLWMQEIPLCWAVRVHLYAVRWIPTFGNIIHNNSFHQFVEIDSNECTIYGIGCRVLVVPSHSQSSQI